MSKPRVVHVVSHPIQYFAPLYRAIERRGEVDLSVVVYSDATLGRFRDEGFAREVEWDSDLADGYHNHVPARSMGRSLPRRGRHAVRPDIFREVLAMDADVLWLHGYHLPTSLALAYAFLARGRPVVLRGEQTLLQSPSAARRRAKDLLMAPLVKRARCAYIGERNRDYLRRYGATDSSLYFSPYAVPPPSARPTRDEARARLGLDPALPVVLFVGKLIDRKQPLLLVDAWLRTRESHPSCLVFAGDGPLKHVIERTAPGDVGACIKVTGFLNQSEMPLAYAAADVFVLPSTGEPWGLVVNEALMAGLPAIVTTQVGSARDLVADGWNGYAIPPADPERLAARLRLLVENRDHRQLLGARGRERVSGYSVETAAEGLLAAFVGNQARAPLHTPIRPAEGPR